MKLRAHVIAEHYILHDEGEEGSDDCATGVYVGCTCHAKALVDSLAKQIMMAEDAGREDERARILALCEHYNLGPGHRLVKAIVGGEDVRDE